MTLRRLIMAASCLCGWGCCAAFSRFDAEDVVRRQLVKSGIRQGYDFGAGVYTAIASAVRNGGEGDAAACFRMAELKAVHQILNMRRQSMAGGTSVRRDPAEKSARTFVETLSRSDLEGCLLAGFHGRLEGGRCVVAVAMSWGEDLERRARASGAGALRPAESWMEELKAVVDGMNGGLPPPTVSFVDSAGFFHRAGVGASRLNGSSPLLRDVAARSADLMARKNLQLALYGRAEMRKKAELMKSSSRLDGAEGLSSVYEALGAVSARGELPQGSRPLFDRVVSAGGGKLWVSVYGVEPPPVAHVATPPAAPPPGIMLFNPVTGKYEKQN